VYKRQGVYRKPILDTYDYEKERFLGDAEELYYLSDGDDESKESVSEWCEKNNAGSESYRSEEKQTCSDETDAPDLTFDELLDMDAFIVGLAIQGTKDGKRCAINIFGESLDLTMTEGSDEYIWSEDGDGSSDEEE
jgi:hypothetical protein